MTQISRKRISTWSTCTVCNKVRFIEGLDCPIRPLGPLSPLGYFPTCPASAVSPRLHGVICIYTGFSANLRTFFYRERAR